MKKLIGIGSLAKTALLIAATSRTVNDPENTDNRRFAPFYDRDVIPHNGSTFEFVGVDMDAKRCEPDDFLIGYKIPPEHQLIITDEAVNIEPMMPGGGLSLSQPVTDNRGKFCMPRDVIENHDYVKAQNEYGERFIDIFSDPSRLETALRKLDMPQRYGVSLRDYDHHFRRREPVPVYERGDTRQLVFGQIVEQRGPVIDTSRVTKRSKRRNRHK